MTGVEAAKMMLVAAGYSADKAGLEGSAWIANTMRYANLNDLFDDVVCDINSGLPRQYAAQIMFNSLDMERVVYSNDIATSSRLRTLRMTLPSVRSTLIWYSMARMPMKMSFCTAPRRKLTATPTR